MQSKNKNDSIQFSTRYQQYDFAKRHLRGGSGREIFPIRGATTKIIKTKKFSEPISNCLRTNYLNGHSNETYIKQLNNPTHSNDRVYSEKGLSPTLNTMQGGRRQPFVKMNKKGKQKKDQKNASCLTGGGHSGGNHSDMDLIRAVLTPDRKNKRQNGRRMKENGEPSFTLTGQDKHGIYNGTNIRRFTPKECERLQGFPDDFSKYGINEKGETVLISDSQRYRQCGNAVTTNVVEAVISKLFF